MPSPDGGPLMALCCSQRVPARSPPSRLAMRRHLPKSQPSNTRYCEQSKRPTSVERLCVACGACTSRATLMCANCADRVNQSNRKWGSADTEEVVAFLCQTRVADFSIDALALSLAVHESDNALNWLTSRGQTLFKSHVDSEAAVRRVLRLWMTHEQADEVMNHWLITWSVRGLCHSLRARGCGILVGAFSCLFATRVCKGVIDWDGNRGLILEVRAEIERICRAGERVREPSTETGRIKSIAGLIQITFSAELPSSLLGSAQLLSYREPFIRIVSGVTIRAGLPILVTKLILCHELTHVALWLRKPYRKSGTEPLEEIVCHVVMLDYIKRCGFGGVLSSHDNRILARRVAAATEESLKISGSTEIMRRWARLFSEKGWDYLAEDFRRTIFASDKRMLTNHR